MRQRITDILPTPDGLQGKGIRDLPNERAISRPQDKSGTNRMPRQTDTAEPFPGRNDMHATSRQRNDTLTSSPSMPPIPTRNGPYFAKQNRDDAPPAVPPPRLPQRTARNVLRWTPVLAFLYSPLQSSYKVSTRTLASRKEEKVHIPDYLIVNFI